MFFKYFSVNSIKFHPNEPLVCTGKLLSHLNSQNSFQFNSFNVCMVQYFHKYYIYGYSTLWMFIEQLHLHSVYTHFIIFILLTKGSGDETSHIWRLPVTIYEQFSKNKGGSPNESSPDVSKILFFWKQTVGYDIE